MREQRESRSGWPVASTSAQLSGLGPPLLCQFCVVLVERRSTDGTHSSLIVVSESHKLEKVLTSRDPPLISKLWMGPCSCEPYLLAVSLLQPSSGQV